MQYRLVNKPYTCNTSVSIPHDLQTGDNTAH